MLLVILRRAILAFAALLALLTITAEPQRAAFASDGRQLFITSASEHADGTVTLPLYRGVSKGQTVYYIILDASDGNAADRYGVNRSQKLANAANTGLVQRVSVVNGVVSFPGTVDFSPDRVVVPGPQGFPPLDAQPGARGDADYSPLIQLPDGTVLNAPQIANASGQADKVVSIDTVSLTVTYRETNGFQGGKPVKYVSTDASDEGAAVLEDVTYAPKLNQAPQFFGDDSTASAFTSLAAFTNGQTGAANGQRQGLNSALLDGLDPLNVLRWNPSQGRYSPLWDVHFAQWSQQAISSGQNTRQIDWGQVQNLADQGLITPFGGGTFDTSRFIVNCPIVSMN
jgi:hypothetical protein